MRDVTDISSPSVLLSKVLLQCMSSMFPYALQIHVHVDFLINVHVVECACMMMSQVVV